MHEQVGRQAPGPQMRNQGFCAGEDVVGVTSKPSRKN